MYKMALKKQRRRAVLFKTPPCRVLRSFEPAEAGWVPPEMPALAKAYRVTPVSVEPLFKVLAQNRCCNITHTAGYFPYTMFRIKCVDALNHNQDGKCVRSRNQSHDR
jgi:hypothetical protein